MFGPLDKRTRDKESRRMSELEKVITAESVSFEPPIESADRFTFTVLGDKLEQFQVGDTGELEYGWWDYSAGESVVIVPVVCVEKDDRKIVLERLDER